MDPDQPSTLAWLKLTQSKGEDLGCPDGKNYLQVTTKELMLHNKREDAWISIGGMITFQEY